MKGAGLESRTLRVVMAEDDDDHALLIRMALQRVVPDGVELHRAVNGLEALALARQVRPDLLLLDLRMPEMSGHEVLEHLKNDEELRRIPVAVLTSSDREDDMARSYGLGSNHFITKPSDPAQLEARFRTLLRNLPELALIRRGAGGLLPSAVSAESPESLAARRLVAWGAILVLLGVVLVFGYCRGVLP